MTDFTREQRMSLGAFFIYFLKYFRMVLGVTVIAMSIDLVGSDSSLGEKLARIATVLAVTAGIALVLAAVAYFQMKFHIEGDNLIYRHNIIPRTTTVIPLSSIHSLRTRRGLLYRLLDLRGILVDTLAAKGEEIELILSESDWQTLLGLIERQERPAPLSASQPPVYDPVSVRKFRDSNLVADALCQNHLKGMAVLAGFIAVILNSISDISENAIETAADYLDSHLPQFAVSLTGAAIFLSIIYIISLVLWLGKVLLRYHDMKLSYTSRMLTFSHGLVARLTSRFAYDKICTVWVKRNPLEKRFGLCTLALRQALNASALKADDNLTIYGKDTSGFFLCWWLGDGYDTEPDVAVAISGRGVLTRSLLVDLLLSATATVILLHFVLYVWLLLPALYMAFAIPKAILTMRHSHITLRPTYLVIGQGRFAEIKNYLKYSNIETIQIRRSPLTPLTGRVTLTISTPGNTFSIRSLTAPSASNIRARLLSKTA